MKVLSFNIQSDTLDYDDRLQGILNFVNKEDPDIISFQEVKYGSYKTIIKSLCSQSVKYFILDKRVEYGRLYGELMFSKYPIKDSSYVSFNVSNNQRGLTSYFIEKNGEEVLVCTTHLDIGKQQSKQIKQIQKEIDKSKRVILLGDFNFFDDEQSFDEQSFNEQSFLEMKDCNVGGTYTYVDDKYKSRPDRIYYKGFKKKNFITYDLKLSDHKCISASLKCCSLLNEQ